MLPPLPSRDRHHGKHSQPYARMRHPGCCCNHLVLHHVELSPSTAHPPYSGFSYCVNNSLSKPIHVQHSSHLEATTHMPWGCTLSMICTDGTEPQEQHSWGPPTPLFTRLHLVMHCHFHTSALNPLGTIPNDHVVTALAELSDGQLILRQRFPWLCALPQNGTGQDRTGFANAGHCTPCLTKP